MLPTIFRRLDRRGYSWRIYFHDLPQAATLVDLWPRIPTRFCLYQDEFERHAQSGRLTNYSFIEPRYYPSRWAQTLPNDQHPPHDPRYGDRLIASVYNAVRAAPTWERTLLVIIYDEHGGCFDHVPPPSAVPPGGPYSDGFKFDRYGVRVPAVIVSPFVKPGSIVRPPEPPDGKPAYPFDHCSIQATLHKVFDLGAPLTPRVAAAPDLLSALTLAAPENGGPESIVAAEPSPSREEVRACARRPDNRHQKNLRSPMHLFPGAVAKVVGHVRGLGAKAKSERARRPPA
jgi:phospholipase C